MSLNRDELAVEPRHGGVAETSHLSTRSATSVLYKAAEVQDRYPGINSDSISLRDSNIPFISEVRSTHPTSTLTPSQFCVNVGFLVTIRRI